MFFQNSVIKKYLAGLNNEQITKAWETYKGYFLNREIQENIRSSKEEQFQEGFLRELFVKVLGYTLNPSPNFNLITEQKNETDSKKADGAILRDNNVIGVIELKDHKTTDLSHVERQAFGYKNKHEHTRYVVISNFEKLRFYIDNAVEHIEWNLFSLTEDDFRLLYFCLAWPNICADLPINAKQESVSNEDQITQQLYKDYSAFKREIFADILANNTTEETPKEQKLLLFKKTQKLLDRLLFIFFAEDCGLLPPNSMEEILKQWEQLKEMDEYVPLYNRIKKYFGYMNTGWKGKQYEIFAYNGGLFKPDEILDSIRISDDILARFTHKLAGYDYSTDVDVNILGHIFENSLNEIEEVTAQINAGETPTVSKRKRDGVFYTPQYITKYIVENTVGRLCAEKKAEMGIDEAEYFADKNRQTATKKRLLDQLTMYREWLLGITICDPACGSGAFLNAALQFLMAEHKLIDEMEAKITNSAIVFQEIENSILENNLYGVDINEESVEIARLALWLRTAKPHRKLNSLNNNIKCGNSIISDPQIAGDKAFDWKKEFPQVFEKGGFDVVIGNPPYVQLPPNQLQGYKYARGNNNTYIAFIEQILKLTKSDKNVGLIIPTTWFAGDNYLEFRNFALGENLVHQLIQLPYDIFEAYIDTTIILLNGNRTNNETAVYKYDIHNRTNEINVGSFDYIDSSVWLKYGKIFLNKRLLKVFKKVWNNPINVKLDSIASVNRGCLPPKENEMSKVKNGIFNIKWFNSQVYRYNTEVDDPVYVSYENLRENKPIELYNNSPKILARQLLSRQFRINMTLSTNPAAFKKNLYAIFDIKEHVDIRYLLAYLNSALFSYCEVNFNSSLQRDDFPAFSLNDFREFPIPIISKEDQQPFIELADKMLALNKDLQSKRARFLRRLKDNMPDIKITSTLETFDALDFAGFVAELKKQKIKLSLVQQDEWEEYFGQYKAELNEISAQISATDKEIDKRVYALYGLTEEEIRVIEA